MGTRSCVLEGVRGGDLSPIGRLEGGEIEMAWVLFHGWSAPEGFVPYEPKESFLGSVWCYEVIERPPQFPESGPDVER